MVNCFQFIRIINILNLFPGCRFRDVRTGGLFVRVSEDLEVGEVIAEVTAYPRQQFNVQALDGVSGFRQWIEKKIQARSSNVEKSGVLMFELKQLKKVTNFTDSIFSPKCITYN